MWLGGDDACVAGNDECASDTTGAGIVGQRATQSQTCACVTVAERIQVASYFCALDDDGNAYLDSLAVGVAELNERA